MKFLSVALAVLASASLAGAQNKYMCPGGTSEKTITVNHKAKLQFVVEKQTPNDMDCTANYTMGTCSKAKLVCKFKLNGRGCKGDQALVTANGKTSTACKAKKGKLSANSKDAFSIQVFTDDSKPSKGGKCTIKCISKRPKPTTTTAAPTPPPTTGGSCDCSCGVVQRATRIVGGEETEVSEYPWQAGLVDKGTTRVWCGGSLVNSKWVLTAAHCTDNVRANEIQVLLGEHDYNTAGETDMQRMNVKMIKNHPDYNSATTNNDFAMLKLKKAVDFCGHPHIRPICLPSGTSENYAGLEAIVTGWGTTSSGGSLSNSMLEVTVNVLTNSQCKNDYSYGSSMITSKMLCANVDGGGKDACQGDSGGPLITAGSNNNYQLIGVVSWGYGCALASAPGVYARVTSQLSWINDYLGQDGQSCAL